MDRMMVCTDEIDGTALHQIEDYIGLSGVADVAGLGGDPFSYFDQEILTSPKKHALHPAKFSNSSFDIISNQVGRG